MDYEIKLDETTAVLRRIPFFLPDSSDGYTPQTGESGSLSGFQSKVGASAIALAGSFSEIDQSNMPGLYYYAATAGEVDTQGWIIFTFVCANCITQRIHVRVGMDNKTINGTLMTLDGTVSTLDTSVDDLDVDVNSLMASITAGIDTELKLAKKDDVATDAFIVTDSEGAVVTGLTQNAFDVYLYDPNGVDVSGTAIPVTITELGNGVYRASFTPDEVGDWVLSVFHSTYIPEGVFGNYSVFVQLFDDISLENMGLGNRLVTIMVQDAVTSQPIPGVFVEIFNSDQTTKMAFAYTTSNGRFTPQLFDGTYKVRLAMIGQYEFGIQPKTLVVSGDTSVTYEGTTVSIPTPPSAQTCVVYGWELDLSGNPKSVTVEAEIVGKLNFLSDDPHIVRETISTVTRLTDGFWSLILTRSSEFTSSTVKYRFIIGGAQAGVYSIPDVDQKAFKDLWAGTS